MICDVCGKEFDGVTCPVCNYQKSFFSQTPSAEAIEEEKRKISDYRKLALKEVRMSVVSYDFKDAFSIRNLQAVYEPDNIHRYEMTLDCSGLNLDEIAWLDEPFTIKKEDAPFNIEIINRKGEVIKVSDPMPLSKLKEDLVRIGFKLMSGFQATVVVGSPEAYVNSQVIQL